MYIEPRLELAREVTNHRKYRSTSEEEAKELMCNEKKSAPGSIPYMLCASRDYPGRFVLTYATRVDRPAKFEFIMLAKDGFKLRKQIFPKLEALLLWFKKHYNDAIPGVTVPIRPSSSGGGHSRPGSGYKVSDKEARR